MSMPRGTKSVWDDSIWDDYKSGTNDVYSSGYTFSLEDVEEDEREQTKRVLIDALDNDPELLNEVLQEVRKRKINKIQNVRRKR